MTREELAKAIREDYERKGVWACKSNTINMRLDFEMLGIILEALEQEPTCKECAYWKDSDGKYRRGIEAESKCPINTHTVYCGEGYCYMFSPKADIREVKE